MSDDLPIPDPEISDEEVMRIQAGMWQGTPEAFQRIAMSIDRLNRLVALGSPELIRNHERWMIAKRIPVARTYLDELDALYGEWRDKEPPFPIE